MLRINLPALANLLDETYKMENTLCNEIDNHKQTAAKMRESWHGEASANYQHAMYILTSCTGYPNAYSYVKNLREMLEYFYQTAKQLIARCEQVGEQLMQDAYVEPLLGWHEEVTLTLNYDYISSLNGDCAMALNSAEKAKKVLQRMMEESARRINWSNEEDELYYAWKKMQRLENYCDEFNMLAKKASALEYEITEEMDRVIAQNNVLPTLGTGVAAKNMEQRSHDMTTLNEITSVEGVYDITTVIATMNKDTETWTPEDCEYIAGAFEQYLQGGDYIGMNALVNRLMKYEYNSRMNNDMLMPLNDGIYSVQPDLSKIEKITSQIGKIRHSTAYQTLTNLGQVEELKISYDKDDMLGLYVETLQKDKEGQKYFVIHQFAGNVINMNEQNYDPRTFFTTGEDLQSKSVKVYVQDLSDALPAKTMESMEKMGYTYEEIIALLEQHQLTLSYNDYKAMSDADRQRYDDEAKKLFFTLLPTEEMQSEEILQCEYSMPIGYDMTMTYSVTTKGEVPADMAGSTIEFQKGELQSISFSQEDTKISMGKDGLEAGQKIDVGRDVQVGMSFELDARSLELSVSKIDGNVEKGLKYEPKADGTVSSIYYVETKLAEEASVYSEVVITKDNNGGTSNKGWEIEYKPITRRIPELFQRMIEISVLQTPSVPVVPIKVG